METGDARMLLARTGCAAMSRRDFLKWLFSAVALITAISVGIWRFLLPDAQTTAPLPMMGNSPQPLQAPSPEQAKPHKGKGETGALLSFAILSDLHINPDLGGPSEHLQQALDDLTSFETNVDCLVFTGDVADYGREKDYKEIQRNLNRYKLPPIYANMGNHDYYNVWMEQATGNFNRDTFPNGKTDAQSREMFMKFFHLDQPYNEAVVNGYTLLMLSQEAYQQEKVEVGEGAWYSDRQLGWLKDRLAAVKNGKPVFVMIHQPLPAIGSDGGSHQLIRAKEFRSILKPYPNVFVFSGHNHQDFLNGQNHYVKETFHWFQNSSVGKVMNRKYQTNRPDAAQGLYLQVFADRVIVRGREFSRKEWIKEADWTVSLKSGKV